jgi:hypothetical protein
MKLVSDYGKGATSDELTQLFFEFYKIVRKNPHISSNPLALCMYIKNFGKDKMSDLITNIIRQLLHKFTIAQCSLWNIPLSKKKHSIGYYWDYRNLSWKELCDNTLEIDGRNFLLVPKKIVRSRYVFNVESYIRQYVLKNLQEEHLSKNSDMCIKKEYADGRKVLLPPTIKELYKKEVQDTVHKDYALQASFNNESSEKAFVKDVLSRIGDGYGELSDVQLDEIVYKRHKMSA